MKHYCIYTMSSFHFEVPYFINFQTLAQSVAPKTMQISQKQLMSPSVYNLLQKKERFGFTVLLKQIFCSTFHVRGDENDARTNGRKKTLTIFICGTALFPLSDLLETIRVRFILLRLIIRRDIIARGEVGIDLGQKQFLSDSFKSRQKGGKCAWGLFHDQ